MSSQAILDELKAHAYNGDSPVLGDALAMMTHWLAERSQALPPEDVMLLKAVCLALYRHELEKSWNVSADEGAEPMPPAVPISGTQGAGPRPAQAGAEIDAAARAAADADVQRHTLAERHVDARVSEAIDALLLRRRADTSEDGAPRRRWTDNPFWALTIRR